MERSTDRPSGCGTIDYGIKSPHIIHRPSACGTIVYGIKSPHIMHRPSGCGTIVYVSLCTHSIHSLKDTCQGLSENALVVQKLV